MNVSWELRKKNARSPQNKALFPDEILQNQQGLHCSNKNAIWGNYYLDSMLPIGL